MVVLTETNDLALSVTITMDASTLPLHPRRGLSVIPQQPFLYSGTVRQNLDPAGLSSDTVLWAALTECHLRYEPWSLGNWAGEGGWA